jgi:hypothetical protein
MAEAKGAFCAFIHVQLSIKDSLLDSCLHRVNYSPTVILTQYTPNKTFDDF